MIAIHRVKFTVLAVMGMLCSCSTKETDWCQNEVEKLVWIELADPVVDAKIAIAEKNLKFMAVHGIAIDIPGLGKNDSSVAYSNNNYAAIEGTGDDLCSEKHAQLDNLATSYAKTYNQTIVEGR